MPDEIGALYLRDAIERFRTYKKLGEKAMIQVYDSGLAQPLGPEENSLAILVQHLAGNMRSRWTSFLTTDGEKPDRNRDGEFELQGPVTRAEMMERWEDGWARLFEALSALAPADLTRTISIRGQPHSVLEAINIQLAHYAYHVGQIVQMSRHQAGARWQTLSIPRRRPT